MGEHWISVVKSDLEWELQNPAAAAQAWQKKCIYRAPKVFAQYNADAFAPLMASFGPFHHGKSHLMPMEQHKRRALTRYLKRAKRPLDAVVEAMREEAKQLMDSYDGLEEEWAENENRFLQLMILDGCFMLEILSSRYILSGWFEDYSYKDPLFSKTYVMSELHLDMLKLENQLPMRALFILASFAGDQIGNITDLILANYSLYDEARKFSTGREGELQGLHILDLYRKALLLSGSFSCNSYSPSRSAVELSDAGVDFERSDTKGFKDISFRKGVLRLPRVLIDDNFEPKLRNLVAYEHLHGAGQEVTAYIFFMDWIINTGNDVMLLRKKHILDVSVGSDDDVANIFNKLTKKITLNTEHNAKVVVTQQLNDYCRRWWPRSRASFVKTYLRNPWVFISLLAGFVLLGLTTLQTVFTLYPYYNPRS